MRTREEQISALACCLYGQDMTANRATAEHMVHEAEQRVRAEIGRDSERLDWLGENPHHLKNTSNNFDWMGRDVAQRRAELRRQIDEARGKK